MKEKKTKEPLLELRVVTLRLPEYQYRYLTQMAEMTGTTMAETIRQLVDIYIEVE